MNKETGEINPNLIYSDDELESAELESSSDSESESDSVEDSIEDSEEKKNN